MNVISTTAGLALLCLACTAAAQEPQTTLPTVEVNATLHTFDCDKRSLPSQREVGEWTGQDNFSQVYDTRARLMGEVSRACKRAGIEQVNLVMAHRPHPYTRNARWVARVEPARR